MRTISLKEIEEVAGGFNWCMESYAFAGTVFGATFGMAATVEMGPAIAEGAYQGAELGSDIGQLIGSAVCS